MANKSSEGILFLFFPNSKIVSVLLFVNPLQEMLTLVTGELYFCRRVQFNLH